MPYPVKAVLGATIWTLGFTAILTSPHVEGMLGGFVVTLVGLFIIYRGSTR